MDITINIRSPSLNDTLVVVINTDSTIANLKESIESVHPQHPLPSNQRIIYNGKLLEDSDTLLNILKKVDKEVHPIFHLVVKPSVQSLKQAPLKPAFASPILQQTQPRPEQTPQPPPEQPQINQNETLPQLPGMLPGGYQVVYIK
ncbi:uncharacterized protein B0P05DRAFT_559357 [Gilbertella persicaria]|uniref:Ubiquitin-like domain-containing protein n=1 Tax=Rhizopus stolonifer TaxID=4846 RepID=A0A367K7N8_RHIST|nr:uncharacterized protein B0P05DRAFT_559357 [Gilbertella persicaria]KAI8058657.1 hypothetical protein B0P05DRAFT_559357 [Gilbertella persicaria]RCH98224.1 hypothetical protein CU098_011731 [Rhizopus stolonifer]